MAGFEDIPSKFIRQLAKENKVKHRGRDISEVIGELEDGGAKGSLEYLEAQCRYAGSNLTIVKTNPFPEKSSKTEKFLHTLVNEKYISGNQIGSEWEPTLKQNPQLCAIHVDGSDVYLKLVEGKTTYRKKGYSSYPEMYATFSSAVIHFSDQVIELRCSYTDRKKYTDFIMKMMGFGEPYEWAPITIVTKDEAKSICSLLSAGVSSTQIEIPSTVGSMRFNGKKNINLRNDEWYTKIKEAIKGIGLPTDKTTDETCFFKFTDPVTNIEIDVSFEVNLTNGGFKFLTKVTEAVYEHVLEAFIQVCYTDKQNSSTATVAAGLAQD
jgi:hypothetical protein